MAKKSGIQNLSAFEKRLAKHMVKNPELHVRSLIRRSTTLVEATAKESILKGGTGITYQKYNPRRQHIASAPNEPPASDTGFLVNSISSRVRKKDKEVIGEVIASAPYAAWLEFGTEAMLKKGGARPFMQPALERNRPKIKRIFKEGGYVD